jgi:hypothetical protein
MRQKSTLKLKYSYKKGSRLISINDDLHHHSQNFQNSKALTNKFISPLDQSTMLGGINLDTTAFQGTYPTKMFTRYVLT